MQWNMYSLLAKIKCYLLATKVASTKLFMLFISTGNLFQELYFYYIDPFGASQFARGNM